MSCRLILGTCVQKEAPCLKRMQPNWRSNSLQLLFYIITYTVWNSDDDDHLLEVDVTIESTSPDITNLASVHSPYYQLCHQQAMSEASFVDFRVKHIVGVLKPTLSPTNNI